MDIAHGGASLGTRLLSNSGHDCHHGVIFIAVILPYYSLQRQEIHSTFGLSNSITGHRGGMTFLNTRQLHTPLEGESFGHWGGVEGGGGGSCWMTHIQLWTSTQSAIPPLQLTVNWLRRMAVWRRWFTVLREISDSMDSYAIKHMIWYYGTTILTTCSMCRSLLLESVTV